MNGSVRFLHGTERFLHGFMNGTVRFFNGTVCFLHCTVDHDHDHALLRWCVPVSVVQGQKYHRNTVLPIFRAQDVNSEQLYVQNTYTHLIFLNISKQEIPDIRIYIRNDRLHTGQSVLEHFNCVLSLREKIAMASLEELIWLHL